MKYRVGMIAYQDITKAALAQLQSQGWRLDSTFPGKRASGKSRRARWRADELERQGIPTRIFTDVAGAADYVWRGPAKQGAAA